ncbi:MAG: ribose transport system substrate-binding protein [Chloroflexota bacterium]|nr:ribose transport system substrate-binding protein [Chloroflexota bacterium]
MLRLKGPLGWTDGTFKRGLGLSMVAVLAISGCSNSASSPAASVAAPTTAASQGAASTAPSAAASGGLAQYIGAPDKALCGGKQWTIGYDSFSDTESFAVALKQGLEKAASDLGCVTIKALVDNADAATAVQNAKVLAQQKVDGAILFNVIQAASTGQSQALKAANIPLVSLAVPVDGYPFITNDDSANGVQAGEALGNAFKASGLTAGVALIGRFDDQDSTKQRADGVIQGLKNTAPEVTIQEYATKADGPTTQAATAALLPKVPAGSAILISAPNDDLTFASFQAVKQASRLDHAFAMGIGGVNPVGLDYVCKNKDHYVGTVGFFPENWPNFLLPALLAEAQGATVPVYPQKITVKTEVITPANVKTFYPDYTC